MRRLGTLTRWKDDEGFGFIRPDGGGEEVFVHVRAFSSERRRPAGMERLSYVLGQDSRGRPRALRVVFTDNRPLRGRARRRDSTPLGGGFGIMLIAPVFFALVAWLALEGRVPAVIAFGYAFVSLVTVLAYALDKSAAMGRRWRISERTLHLFALAGGWPGALVAQRLFRHKSRKTSFQVVFWASVAFNLAALGLVMSGLDMGRILGFLGHY